MLNRRTFLSTALAAATGSRFARAAASCSAPDGYTVAEPPLEQIERIVRANLPTVSSNIGAAVGVASPSFGAQILCIGSLVNQGGNPAAFTTDTPFEVASMTKTFTATAYQLLLQGGQIKSSDTLGQYLPELASSYGGIKLSDLVDYTSGLPMDNMGSNGTYPPSLGNNSYTEADMFNFLASSPFNISPPPGTSYSYSNLGFSLLALALAAAVGAASFGALLDTEILGPLGMVKTQVYNSTVAAALPRGFDENGDAASSGWPQFPAYYGAGGVVGTPNDMMTWLQFNMSIIANQSLGVVLPVLQAPVMPEIPASSNTVCGLGWFTSVWEETGSKLTVVQKNGDLPGFCSQMAFVAPDGCSMSPAGAFALVNYHDSASGAPPSPATNIAQDLLFALTNQEPPVRISRPRPLAGGERP